jgi:hypothetical protein
MTKTIKKIKKELGIGNRDIADAFGYKNREAYSMSTAKPRIERGIEWLHSVMKKDERPTDEDSTS